VPVLQTTDLVKRYGKIEALKGVSLRVDKGEIYGLLGQNGAGKTTLIKVLLGIAHKSSGSAWLLDEPAGSVLVRRRIGYLPEDHRFPDYHSAETLLNFYAKLTGVPRDERRRRTPAVLDLVGLSDRKGHKVRTYSKGMKQRLGLAQAMYHRPEVIFLDEPTDGVDPLGRREIRGVMQRLRELGTTIFLNSHLLGEVELVCDRVAILQRGAVVREGDVAALTRVQGLYLLGLAPDEAFPMGEARRLGYAAVPAGDLWEVSLSNGQTIDPLVKLLAGRGLNLRHLVEKRQTLEDLFLQTVTANGK
jgi:ABC-2 type transport system ATP-binding protein